jgi:predicted ATPase
MLKRIYIDNYKCLVNFELNFGPVNLFLGPNGGGKTSVFETLQKLQLFVGQNRKVADLLAFSDRTRWQSSLIQTFELEIERDGKVYKYELAVEHDEKGQTARVKYERLWYERQPLLKFESDEVQLYRDNGTSASPYAFDSSLSALAFITPRSDNQLLTWFKEQLPYLIIAQIIPPLMDGESAQEEKFPSVRMDNYASWYRYLSQDQGLAFQLTDALRKCLPGFDYFKFTEAGERHRTLKVFFTSLGQPSASTGYDFSELSDGQRMLIALYTLLLAAQSKDATQSGKHKFILCLDEPENYLALPEIQPWMVDLYDLCSEGQVQALLISHHPESIDYLLASPIGYWFERQNNLATRVKQIRADDDGGLPVSELIARGWLNA